MKHSILAVGQQSQFGPGTDYWNGTYQLSTFQDDNYFLWSRSIVLEVMILLAVPSSSASPSAVRLNQSMNKLILFEYSDESVGCAKFKRPACLKKSYESVGCAKFKGQSV